VGSHGPDIVAFGFINSKFRIVVGEVKGMKSSRVLSSLDRLSDGTMQMSARWIEKFTDKILDPVFNVLVNSAGGYLPGPVKRALQVGLENINFDLYLLRARRYERNRWILKGFRLMNLGEKLVGLGEPLQNEIEREYETKGPPDF